MAVTRRRVLQQGAQISGTAVIAPWLIACGGQQEETSDTAEPPAGETPTPTPAPAPIPTPTPTPVETAPPIKFVTTPAERFSSIADFPYTENYMQISGMRMHYVDTGPRDAQHIFLCLHGQPTWSYLYRKMIPVFTAAGGRVIAPDWFGFGKSDKPVDDAAYTFTFHRETILQFIKELDLKNITLVAQDWGGLLGLTIPPSMPERFSRLIIMNTTFATGAPLDPSMTDWQSMAEARRERWLNTTDVNIPRLIQAASTTATAETAAVYDAPFPDITYEAGARRFPVIVPISPDEDGAAISREAMSWWSTQWSGKSFMAIGMQDNLLGPEVMNVMKTLIRNCPAPMEINEAGHFVQEDAGKEIAEAAIKAFG